MKKWILSLLGLCVVAILFVIFLTDVIIDSRIKYKVFFEEAVDILESDIVYGDIIIGNVTGDEAKISTVGEVGSSYTIYEILIDKRYKELIHSNCTFYPDNNRLAYTRVIERDGLLLAEGSVIKAFENKMAFFAFRTNTVLVEKINDFRDWYSQRYPVLFR